MTNQTKLGIANAAVGLTAAILVLLCAQGIILCPAWTVELTILTMLLIVGSIPLAWHFQWLDQELLARKGRRFSDRTFAGQYTNHLRELVHVEGGRLRSVLLPVDVPANLAEPLVPASGTTHQVHDALTFPKVRFIRRMRGGLTGIPTGIYFLEDADVVKNEPQYWRVAAVTELEPTTQEF